jgi:hypothetical protein
MISGAHGEYVERVLAATEESLWELPRTHSKRESAPGDTITVLSDQFVLSEKALH